MSGSLRRAMAYAGTRPMLPAAPRLPAPALIKARPLGDVYHICQSPETSCGSLYHVWTSEGGRAPSTTQPEPEPCTLARPRTRRRFPPAHPPAHPTARPTAHPTGVLESVVRMCTTWCAVVARSLIPTGQCTAQSSPPGSVALQLIHRMRHQSLPDHQAADTPDTHLHLPLPSPDAYPSLSVRHTTHATPPTSLCRRSSPHHCGCGSRSPCHRRRRKAREHVMAVALHACIGAPRQPSCNEKATCN